MRDQERGRFSYKAKGKTLTEIHEEVLSDPATENPDFRYDLGLRGRDYAGEGYSSPKVAVQLAELHENLQVVSLQNLLAGRNLQCR